MQSSTLIFVMVGAILAILNLPDTEARMTLVQIRNAVKGAGKTCAGKIGVAPEILVQSKNHEFPPDRNLQCYYLCLFTQVKATKDGKIVMDMMNKQMDILMPTDIVARTKEVMQQCYDSATSEEECEKSWQITKCVWETDSSIYIFP